MKNKALLVTGSSGYVMQYFNFRILENSYDIFYIKYKNLNHKKNEYLLSQLDQLEISLKNYSEIKFLSFGSSTSNKSFKEYIESIDNFEYILNFLIKLEKNLYVYHASSLSTFPLEVYNLVTNKSYKDFNEQDPYRFSKLMQNRILIKASKLKNVSVKIVHFGWVYSTYDSLLSRFKNGSIKIGPFVLSSLQSPFKLIYATPTKLIYQDIMKFLKEGNKSKKSLENVFLKGSQSPITIFQLFKKNGFYYISPLPLILSFIFSILLIFLRKHSTLAYICRQYLKINSSVKF